MPSIDLWLAQHPLAQAALVFVVLGVLSAIANWLARTSTPEEWEKLKREHPRVAASVSLLRGLGVDPVKAVRALQTLFTGRWGGPSIPQDTDTQRPPNDTLPPKQLRTALWMKLCVVLLLALDAGCMLAPRYKASTVRVEASPERCSALDDRQSVWGSIGAGAGLLSGGSGLSTIAVANDNARVGLAITSAVFGAVAAGAQFFARSTAQTFVHEGCGEAEKLWPPSPKPASLDGGVFDARAGVQ